MPDAATEVKTIPVVMLNPAGCGVPTATAVRTEEEWGEALQHIRHELEMEQEEHGGKLEIWLSRVAEDEYENCPDHPGW